MLDHLLGKPSPRFKRIQVLLTLIFGWHFVVYGKTKTLPKFIQSLNRKAGQTPWRLTLASWLVFYLSQNIFLLLGLNAPDPLARLYKRSFYRATWILTALDAGFFTAMTVKRPVWLRHTLSILFSGYYLIFADAAEDKVRKIRATISVEQMRVSWEKAANNPILSGLSRLLRPRLTMEDIIQVPRQQQDSNSQPLPSVEVYRLYAGDPKQFAQHDTIVLQFPGGGFVSMGPASHLDSLSAWANETKLPVFSVNYKKAPEYSYPWPIEECFDLYVSIVRSRGKLLGLSGEKDISIILMGDSAGGNITAAVTLKILEHNQKLAKTTAELTTTTAPTTVSDDEDSVLQKSTERSIIELTTVPKNDTNNTKKLTNTNSIPVPIGVILIYPALDFEMSCWMSPAQLSLIRAESTSSFFRSASLKSLWETKDHLSHASPLSVVPDLEEEVKAGLLYRLFKKQPRKANKKKSSMGERVQPLAVDTDRNKKIALQATEAWATSRLAMTSRMSFFNDRVISADLMRAMAILYLGPHANPDFENDYLLSPIQAPDELLAQFPMTYLICGEKDPFVDDSVLFAGRIRQAKARYHHNQQQQQQKANFNQSSIHNYGEGVHVRFLEGISHAFLQMMPFLPEAHQAVRIIGGWINDIAQPPLKQQEVIVTNENDMIRRRKQQLLKGLLY